MEAWTSKKMLGSDTLFAGLLRDYERKKALYDTSIISRGKFATAYSRWRQDSAAAKLARLQQVQSGTTEISIPGPSGRSLNAPPSA